MRVGGPFAATWAGLRRPQSVPQIVAIDEHPPLLDHVEHQRWRVLRVGEPDHLKLAADPLSEPSGEFGQAADVAVTQGDEQLDSGAG